MSQPLRILTLSTLFPNPARPAFGIFVPRQSAALATRENVEVEVCAPVGLPPSPFDLHPRYRALTGLAEHDSWQNLSVWRPRFTLVPRFGARINPRMIAKAVLPGLRARHEERPFDLIDAEFFYPDGPAAMIIAEELGLPFTIMARGSDIHYWAGEASARRSIFEAAEAAGGLLAASEAMRSDMVELGMAEDKITVLHPGIDRSLFRPGDRAAAKAALGIDGPLIVSIGTLDENKRHRLMIEALAALPGIHLTIIGDGPLREELPSYAQQHGVGDRVTFTGPRAPEDVPTFLRAADLSVLVSANEGLANAWVEALACGVPLIASDVGGIREVIRSDVAGRILPADTDAAQVAAAVRDILADPPSPDDVAAEVAHFGWDRTAEVLEDFFRTTVEARRVSSRQAA